jgi:hypothetical protein
MEWRVREGDRDRVSLETYHEGQDFTSFEVDANWDGYVGLTLFHKDGSDTIHVCDLTNFIEMLNDLQEKIIEHFEDNPRA